VTDERKAIVEVGYDAIAERYLAWIGQIDGDPRDRFLDAFSERLPEGAAVLDLGCGAGVPSTRRLAERFDVVGVDISMAQLRLARENVPTARFVQGDASTVSFPAASFDGVVSLYAISHVPREEHADLFRRVAGWLEPGGVFLAVLGAGGLPDWTGEWLGVPMYFSSFDADTNRSLLAAAGFDLLLDEVVEMREPEGDVGFLWALGQTPVSAGV
jgi:SAM-dependent methyltransferase